MCNQQVATSLVVVIVLCCVLSCMAALQPGLVATTATVCVGGCAAGLCVRRRVWRCVCGAEFMLWHSRMCDNVMRIQQQLQQQCVATASTTDPSSNLLLQ